MVPSGRPKLSHCTLRCGSHVLVHMQLEGGRWRRRLANCHHRLVAMSGALDTGICRAHHWGIFLVLLFVTSNINSGCCSEFEYYRLQGSGAEGGALSSLLSIIGSIPFFLGCFKSQLFHPRVVICLKYELAHTRNAVIGDIHRERTELC